MFLPLRTDSPLRHSPYMNWALIVANMIVFLITLFTGNQGGANYVMDHFALSSRQPEVYQFFTYQFLHSGWLHIAGNMLFLYIFGNNVNDRMGHIGYLAFYLAGGVCSGLAYVATQSNGVPMVGASGAISAVTGAYLVLLPRSNVTVFFWYFIIGSYDVPSIWFILFFFGYDIFLNFAGGDQVAHMAHIGGTIYGIMVCSGLLVFHLLPRDHFDIVALAQRWNRRRQYRDMVSKGYNPFDYTRVTDPPNHRAAPPPLSPTTQSVMELRGAISQAISAHDLDLAAKQYLELKVVDPQQVLAAQNQLDVANHLAHQQLYPQAAEAYEAYLRQYPRTGQVEQVELMLGLIYARYLAQNEKARTHLTRAIEKLHGDREIALAREELARLGPPPAAPAP